VAASVAYEPVELHDLTKVEQELARWRRTEEGIAGFRATTLNLVIHAADDAHANTAIDALSEIGAARPLRAIIATSAEDSPRAILSSSCFAAGEDHRMWCSEQILLSGRAEALPSAIVSLLLPDLPVFLWWQGSTATGGRTMRALAEHAARLIVSSDECGLDRLAELHSLPPALTDLAWARLTPWREAVARMFDAPGQRPALDRLSAIDVRGPDNEAWLVAGWLRSRLRRSVALDAKPARQMTSVVLHCGDQQFSVRRLKGTDLGRTSAPGVPEKTVMLEEPRVSALLAEELDVFGRDRVFEEALAAAREDR
jgi:glucose-6-phosphate dehydrogenase assembly protein OpcA